MRKAMQIFGMLDDRDIEWIATAGSARYLDAGNLLIEEKKIIDSIYILLDGELAVLIRGMGNVEVATLYSGEIVGEISFVDGRPPLASVMARQDSIVWALKRETLTEKLAVDDGFAARFYRSIASFLAGRLYVTTSRLGYGSAAQDRDVDELPDAEMESVSMGTYRFDALLRKLRSDYRAPVQ
jgi:CRP/FNR family cyclic AMP-dependent transcriptional regulator